MDEDAVICDLAEFYHVLDFRGMQPTTVASLIFGLSENSRTKRKLTGQKLTLEQILLARICDELAFLSWAQTKDGQKNRNRPPSMLEALLNAGEEKEKECNGYESGEDFLDAWRTLTRGKK